jgi:hypothetical protein
LALIEHVLTQLGGTAALRVVAEPHKVTWQIVDYLVEWENTDAVVQGIRTIYPEAEVSVADYQPTITAYPFHRVAFPLILSNTKAGWVAPMRFVEECNTVDPLTQLVQALAGELKEGSRATFTVCASGATDAATRKQGESALKQSNVNWVAVGANLIFGGVSGWVKTGVDLTAMAATGNLQTDKYRPEDQKTVVVKPLMKMLWDVYVVVQVDATDPSDLAHAANVINVLFNGFKTDYNTLIEPPATYGKFDLVEIKNAVDDAHLSAFGLIKRFNDDRYQKQKFRCVLCAHEIAALFHLPHRDFQTPTIAWLESGRPSQAVLRNIEGVVIGKSGNDAIRLPDEDRKTHVNIIGKNGTGKSTLMHNLIHQDIAAGKGVCVVDPHGTLVRDILRASIPNERMADVVLIDVANEDYPPPLNPLAIANEEGSLAVGQVTAIIDKIYGEPAAATRWTNVMQAALSTLRFETTPTVRDVTKLFTDAEYRLGLVNRHRDDLDEVSYEFWERYNALTSEARKDELSHPVVHRMQSFYSSPTLYPILCHPDTLDWRKLILSKRIILVSLKTDEAKIPEREQYMLGAVLVSQLEMAARRFGTKDKFSLYAYIDEAQKLTATPLDKLLSEMRKFGVHLTIANQFLDQFEKPMLSAILGNTGATIAFQIGPSDADRVHAYFEPEVSGEELIKLDRFRTATKMRLHGETQPAFKMQALPPVEPPSDALGREAHIRKLSASLYTPKSRTEVMDWLKQRYPRKSFDVPKPAATSGSEAKRTGDTAQAQDWVVKPTRKKKGKSDGGAKD